MMITRRRLLKAASAGAVLTGPGVSIPQLLEAEAAGLDLPAELPEGTRAEAILDVLPGQEAAPQTGLSTAEFTRRNRIFPQRHHANDAFYVSISPLDIPQVDAKTWKLSIGGEVPMAGRAHFRRPAEMPAFENSRRQSMLRQSARPV